MREKKKKKRNFALKNVNRSTIYTQLMCELRVISHKATWRETELAFKSPEI